MSVTFLCRARAGAAASAMVSVLTASPGNAACFESGVDCTDDHNIPASVLQPLSCDALWTVRSMIFDENDYCFQSARAKAVFSNEGCQYTSMAGMSLNGYEAANIATIRQVERKKGCY